MPDRNTGTEKLEYSRKVWNLAVHCPRVLGGSISVSYSAENTVLRGITVETGIYFRHVRV
jgi:hypothetical protein